MNTVVYGAGSIGCYIGAILHSQGLSVTLLGRERIQKVITEHGVLLTDFEGREHHVEGLNFSTSPEVLCHADLILVTLKCTALVSAIEELKNYAPENAIIVCMQNGVGATEKVKQALPEHKVGKGITPFNFVQGDNGYFHRGTEGALHFSDLSIMRPLIEAWRLFGLPCELHKDINAIVWGKLLLNLNIKIIYPSDFKTPDKNAENCR